MTTAPMRKKCKLMTYACFGVGACFRPSKPSHRAIAKAADARALADHAMITGTADQSHAHHLLTQNSDALKERALSRRISVLAEAVVQTRNRTTGLGASNCNVTNNCDSSFANVNTSIIYGVGLGGPTNVVATPDQLYLSTPPRRSSAHPSIIGTGDLCARIASSGPLPKDLSNESLPAVPGDYSGGSSCRIGSGSDVEDGNSNNNNLNNNKDDHHDDDFLWPSARISPPDQVRKVEAFLLLPQAVATAMDLAFPLQQPVSRPHPATMPAPASSSHLTSPVSNFLESSLSSPLPKLAFPTHTDTPRASDTKAADSATLLNNQTMLQAPSSDAKSPPSLPTRVQNALFKSASFNSRSGGSSVGFGSSSSRTYCLSLADCDSCGSMSRSVISSSRSVGGSSSADSYKKVNIGISTDCSSGVSYSSVAPRLVKAASSGGAMVMRPRSPSSTSAASAAVLSLGGSIPEMAESFYSHVSSIMHHQLQPILQTVTRPAVKPESKRAWCSSTQSRKAVFTAAPISRIRQPAQPHHMSPMLARSVASIPRTTCTTDSTPQQESGASPLQRLRLSMSLRNVDRAITSASKLFPLSKSSQPLHEVKEEQAQKPLPCRTGESVVRQSVQVHLAQPQQKPQVTLSQQKLSGRGYAEIHGAGAALCRHACIRSRVWS